MATRKTVMRLTVEVLPLEIEDPSRYVPAAHLEALKGRKFALPVQLEDTLERVWALAEERYKRNYLTPPQAALFAIKKLQDAYDCDLDLSDTVSSIFEGESDPTKRMIKIVPSIINRDFSVPFTSNLRPSQAHKRLLERSERQGSKKRRLEEQQLGRHEQDYNRDQPIPSTESEHSSDERPYRDKHLRRSKSNASVQFIQGSQTGQAEFPVIVKEESPELGVPMSLTIAESDVASPKSPDNPFKEAQPHSAKIVSSQRNANRMSHVVHDYTRESHQWSLSGISHGTLKEAEDIIMGENDLEYDGLEPATSQEDINREPNNLSSPKLLVPEQNGNSRQDRSEISQTPEFVARSTKRLKSYDSRTPKSNQTTIRSTFLKQQHDEIVSTPEESISAIQRESRRESLDPELRRPTSAIQGRSSGNITPGDSEVSGSVKSSSLKKPSRKAYIMPKPDIKQLNGASIRESLKTPSKSVSNNEALQNILPTSSDLAQESVPTHTKSRTPSTGTRPSESLMAILSRKQSKQRSSSPHVVIPSQKGSSITPGQGTPPTPLRNPPSPHAEAEIILDKPQPSPETSPQVFKRPASKRGSQYQTAEVAVAKTKQRMSESLGPRRTLIRSEIPLPENVRHLTSAPGVSTTHETASTSSRAEFKKPEPKAAKTAPTPEPRDMSASSGSGRAPKRSDIPLPGSAKHRATDNNSSAPRRSTSEIPLPPNVRHLASVNSRAGAPIKHQLTADTRNTHSRASNEIPPLSENRKRPGRPRKINTSSTIPSVTQPTPESVDRKTPSQHSLVPFPKKQIKRGKAQIQPPVPIAPPSSTKEFIVLSSGASNSSDDYSDDDEQASTGADVTQPNGPDLNKIHEEAAQELDGPRHQLADAPPKSQEMGKESMRESVSPDAEAVSQKGGTAKTVNTSEVSHSHNGTPSDVDIKLPEKASASLSHTQASFEKAPWTTNSSKIKSKDGRKDTAGKFIEEDVLRPDINTTVSRNLNSDSESDAKGESSLGSKAQSESRSQSGQDSNRSSPAVSRGPARLLTHSPTPEDSDDEDEESPPPTQPSPPKMTGNAIEESGDESSSTDDSSDSSTDSESEDEEVDEDIEIPDTIDTTAAAAAAAPPSPPRPTSHPTRRIPPLTFPSKPSPYRTPIPLPTTIAKLPASQPTRSRPSLTHKFPSIKDQLHQARSASADTQRAKKFDPRTQSLGKLAKAKAKAKNGLVGGDDDSSSEDESSSSDSDESSSEEDERKRKGAGCSVA
ncbi:hypothetical protein CC78DRAFT_618434 [Lojkania enalia]|uniref:Nucleolar protein Dnt1-like N-terminal domain-containing protein n=1 Tax=Lojkania enalia TaxID=147567 RepID=A0A9P4K4M1_9PLEO|nr:hypothetical protein CC78DRAFT_618434 [Didymosphaeria enalia]